MQATWPIAKLPVYLSNKLKGAPPCTPKLRYKKLWERPVVSKGVCNWLSYSELVAFLHFNRDQMAALASSGRGIELTKSGWEVSDQVLKNIASGHTLKIDAEL